jgi:hypothetical protein
MDTTTERERDLRLRRSAEQLETRDRNERSEERVRQRSAPIAHEVDCIVVELASQRDAVLGIGQRGGQLLELLVGAQLRIRLRERE